MISREKRDCNTKLTSFEHSSNILSDICNQAEFYYLLRRPGALQFLNKLFAAHTYHDDVYLNQRAYAGQAGFDERTVNRWVRILAELRLVETVSRPNRCTIFKFTKRIWESGVRRLLAPWVPSLAYLSLSILTAGIVMQRVEPSKFLAELALRLNTKTTESSLLTELSVNNGAVLKDSVSKESGEVPDSPGNRTDDFQKPAQEGEKKIELIKQLTPTLHLTRLGQCKLTAFSLEALRYAATFMDSHKVMPFAWFKKACMKWYQERGMRLCYKESDGLAARYGLRHHTGECQENEAEILAQAQTKAAAVSGYTAAQVRELEAAKKRKAKDDADTVYVITQTRGALAKYMPLREAMALDPQIAENCKKFGFTL